MSEFFTSDWHFDHANIMKHCKRPFPNVYRMNDVILNNIMKRVKRGDILYVLGDVSMKKRRFAYHALTKLRCAGITLIIVKGNHDNNWTDAELREYFDNIYIMKEVVIRGQKITMCHYPMLSWNCSHYGAWLLHGHHHSHIIQRFFAGKMMNVSVDTNHFSPVSFDEVQEFMDKRTDNWDLKTKDISQPKHVILDTAELYGKMYLYPRST